MKQMIAVFLASTALMSVGTAVAAGDAQAGKAKTEACAACHGKDGNSTLAQNPKLAGQGYNYLLKQLKQFKSKERDNAIMAGQVQGLSEQDMMDIAAYYSSQKVKIGKADENLVTQGEKLYRAGDEAKGLSACTSCHGPSGAGMSAAKFPALSGQHADYIVAQLKAFSKGERANDAGKMMQSIAGKMTQQEMKAVASYIQGLH